MARQIITTKRINLSNLVHEHNSCEELTNHTLVDHGQKQWLESTSLGELAHSDSIESFCAVRNRAFHRAYHHLSTKHLNRHVTQLARKQNFRDYDSIDQMAMVTKGMVGKRFKYKDPIT